ncbi:MAG: PAS domain-containing protein [Alphaproteobacteria bacterium]
MATVGTQDGWAYTAHALTTDSADFEQFGSALAIWRAKAPAGGLPRKRDFSALDFRSWLGRVIIYEVQRAPFDLRFRLCGTDIVNYLRSENTGRLFSEIYGHVPGHRVALAYFEHLADNRVIGFSGGPMAWERMDYATGQCLDLPVLDDAGRVGFFFTFMRLGGDEMAFPARLMPDAPAHAWRRARAEDDDILVEGLAL